MLTCWGILELPEVASMRYSFNLQDLNMGLYVIHFYMQETAPGRGREEETKRELES